MYRVGATKSSKEDDYYHLFEGHEKDFKPYYVAHTNIKTLALLDDEHKGSNWYQWRTRLQPIRTASIITSKIIIEPLKTQLLYLKIAQKAKELQALGLSVRKIAKVLSVSRRTINNAFENS